MRFHAAAQTRLAVRVVSAAIVAAVLVAAVPVARAQAWPAKPIRLIAPYPPGGQTDIVARYLAEKLRPVLGQTIIVDNRAGAQGIVGTEAAAKSPPDGYTFVYTNVSVVSINPGLYPKLPYDPLKDFAPVTQLGLTTLCLVVHPSLPVRSVKDLVALAKRQPGKLSFASFGTGSSSHLYGELLKSIAKVDMTHVPYKGSGPAMQDVMGGHVPMFIGDLAVTGPQIEGKRVVAIAVTGTKRWPLLPDVPTFPETGYALDITGWNGILAPAATPKEIVERMSAEIVKIVRAPEGRDKMLVLGLDPTGTTPEEFRSVIVRDAPRWLKIIRDSGATAGS